MADRTCSVDGCGREVRCKGLCPRHYSRMLTYGDPNHPPHRFPTTAERFWGRVDKAGPDECWQWTGNTNGTGYGTIYMNHPRRSVYAHRWSWEQANGPIPEGLTIDHLCRNTLCVNPAHLEPVTMAENMRRAVEARAARCMSGLHEMTPENTLPGKTRACKACRDAGRARRMEERRLGLRPHGTCAGYTDGCRCPECREAHRRYAEAHRAINPRRRSS